MNICVIGTGYVGLVTGVSLVNFGHKVICVGRDEDKIERINRCEPPFYEPGLDHLLTKSITRKQFFATSNLRESIKQSDITIIAVGTPTIKGEIDLIPIKEMSQQVGQALRGHKQYHIVVVKSTVLPKTTENVVKPIIEEYSGGKAGIQFGICMNPEFLREGNALEDALHPDRIVIGQYDIKSGKTYAKLYKDLGCPILFTGLSTAEMIKYSANAFFATLISYSNEIARLCEEIDGIDIVNVWKGLHLDARLTPTINGRRIIPGFINYLFSGCGYGGSCFPKDTKALVAYSQKLGYEPLLIKSVIKINKKQPLLMVLHLKRRIRVLKNKNITVLGLAFKPETDDTRESPAFPIIRVLLKEGANVKVCDPRVKNLNEKSINSNTIKFAKNIEDALSGAQAVLVVTAWDEFKKLTPKIFKKYMNNPIVVDGRRIYNKESMEQEGIQYEGIGVR